MTELEGKDFRWCCYDRPGQRLKCVALICSLVQAAELIRLVLVTDWLITPSWDKYVLLELIFLLLLLLSNLLLLVGATRSQPDELLPWLTLHTLALFLQAFFVIYLIVSISLVALPATQNGALDLPRGMKSSSPEFLQARRWTLGVAFGKLLALCLTFPTTAYCCWVVFHDRRTLLAVQAASRPLPRKPQPSPGHSVPQQQGLNYTPRRQSLGRSSMMAAAEARRSQSAMGAYSLPQSQITYLERQTSTDTGYNVPSIRSEQARFDRFDSIDEAKRRLERLQSREDSGSGLNNSGFL